MSTTDQQQQQQQQQQQEKKKIVPSKKSTNSNLKKRKTSSFNLKTLYTARKILLELLKESGYKTSDYEDFSINELDAMIAHSQCNMLVEQEEEEDNKERRVVEEEQQQQKKCYIIFHNVNGSKITKTIRKNVVEDYVQDLFHVEEILTKRDTLIIIIDDEPNDTIKEHIKNLFHKEGIFVIVYNIKRLQFNIHKHVLVPEHRILKKREYENFMQKYNLLSLKEIPEISRFDPVAMSIFLRPEEICHIKRKSPTALCSDYYRVCV